MFNGDSGQVVDCVWSRVDVYVYQHAQSVLCSCVHVVSMFSNGIFEIWYGGLSLYITITKNYPQPVLSTLCIMVDFLMFFLRLPLWHT